MADPKEIKVALPPGITQEQFDKALQALIKQRTTGTIRPKAQLQAQKSLQKTFKPEYEKYQEAELKKIQATGLKMKDVTIKVSVPEDWNAEKPLEVMNSAVKARTSGTFKPKAQLQASTSLKNAHKAEYDKMVEENVARITKEMQGK